MGTTKPCAYRSSSSTVIDLHGYNEAVRISIIVCHIERDLRHIERKKTNKRVYKQWFVWIHRVNTQNQPM